MLGEVRALQVQVRPRDLIRFGIGLPEVLAAARRATGIRGAGFIDTPNQRITLQTEGQSLTPERLARTVLVNEGGASTVLGDVATVTAAPEPPSAPQIPSALFRSAPSVNVAVTIESAAGEMIAAPTP